LRINGYTIKTTLFLQSADESSFTPSIPIPLSARSSVFKVYVARTMILNEVNNEDEAYCTIM
jgi:hypothetical protein